MACLRAYMELNSGYERWLSCTSDVLDRYPKSLDELLSAAANVLLPRFESNPGVFAQLPSQEDWYARVLLAKLLRGAAASFSSNETVVRRFAQAVGTGLGDQWLLQFLSEVRRNRGGRPVVRRIVEETVLPRVSSVDARLAQQFRYEFD